MVLKPLFWHSKVLLAFSKMFLKVKIILTELQSGHHCGGGFSLFVLYNIMHKGV